MIDLLAISRDADSIAYGVRGDMFVVRYRKRSITLTEHGHDRIS